jgi:L,D-peptidoglycan transpeptidase YkuD (ErfK/YbiS/YcfS/YnhG family)
MPPNRTIASAEATRIPGHLYGSLFSITYQTAVRDRPLSSIRVRPAAGDPRRGWLTAGGWAVPVALGRGGVLANKREGDGGTPRGIFRPRQLW